MLALEDRLGALAPQLSALAVLLRSAALPALDAGVALHVRGAASAVASEVRELTRLRTAHARRHRFHTVTAQPLRELTPPVAVLSQVALAADALCELAALAPSQGFLYDRASTTSAGGRARAIRGASRAAEVARRGRGKQPGGGPDDSDAAGAALRTSQGVGAAAGYEEDESELASTLSAVTAVLPPFARGKEAEGKRVRVTGTPSCT